MDEILIVAAMKKYRSDVLPVYGLRYPVIWLLLCLLLFLSLALLLCYGSMEAWVYRNDGLTTARQDSLLSVLKRLRPLRLDAPFRRWRENFRGSEWLWQRYNPRPAPHPTKGRYKTNAQPLFYYSARQPLQVLLVGDSLAASVQLSLIPLLSNISNINLTANGIVSSTLTNKHFVDWPATLRKLLRQRHYDLVLVFIGANSCQAIRSDDGSVVSYSSPNWKRVYSQRIREFIAIIKEQGAAAWWLLNPPMLESDYHNCIVSIGTVQQSALGDAVAEIISTADLVAADDGSYTQSKVIDGKLYSLRAKDGVHFTIQGSRLVSKEILRRIRQRYKIIPYSSLALNK